MLSPMRFALLLTTLAGACGGDDPGDDDAPVDAAAVCTARAGDSAERVGTTSGVVHGARDGATWAYRAIPYAAPPIGALRFTAPAPATCASAELDATQLGPLCPQLDEDDGFLGVEDCLQLNVWAPAASSATPRPVMVWIHGGGNAAGSAVKTIYDGRRLAEAGDVIVVTLNYRLAQLGFLADGALATAAGSVGNYGTLDQIAALGWVRDNIAAFGGDPGNVMAFGESAGGRNVCTLLATPGSAGLFHRALIESGSCKFVDTVAQGQAVADDVVAALGCEVAADRVACLRAADVEAVIRAGAQPVGVLEGATFGPVLDGVVLAEQPEAAIRGGRHHAMPIAIGANADETAREAPPTLTEAQYQTLVRAQYGALAEQVLARYPPEPTPRAAFVQLTTDSRFVCPTRQIARHLDAAQTQPVYRYFFSYRASALGAVHGIEIPFVFDTFDQVLIDGRPYVPTAAATRLSMAMQGYWTRFARTGDPGGTPAWPVQGAGDPVIVLDDPVSTATAVREARCDFWAPFYDAQ